MVAYGKRKSMWLGTQAAPSVLVQGPQLMPQLGAGRFTGISAQGTAKERMKLSRFGVLNISSPRGQKTGPTSLHLKNLTFSTAHQT